MHSGFFRNLKYHGMNPNYDFRAFYRKIKNWNFLGIHPNFSGNKIKEIFKKNLARKTPIQSDTRAHRRTFYSKLDLSGENFLKKIL